MRKKYKAICLPTDDEELENFILKNKNFLMECVLDCIESADNFDAPLQLFKFKNSKFMITLSKESLYENVNYILSEYLKEEKYELCNRIKKIQSIL
jgi:hypothetical protein